MPQTITITITKADEIKRAQASAWKFGRTMDSPQTAKLVYNVQADNDDAADALLMSDSYERWFKDAVWITREFLVGTPTTTTGVTTITWSLPSAWDSHDIALKFAIRELLHNGMLADWYDDVKPDAAPTFRKKAELNRAEIKSIIYSIGKPVVANTTTTDTASTNENDGNNSNDNASQG